MTTVNELLKALPVIDRRAISKVTVERLDRLERALEAALALEWGGDLVGARMAINAWVTVADDFFEALPLSVSEKDRAWYERAHHTLLTLNQAANTANQYAWAPSY